MKFFTNFELSILNIKKGAMRYRKSGSGPPLLMLHGNPQTHVMWHKVAPQLANFFTVICPDIPGYGNLVMISHPDGYLSLYAHCEKIFVQTGDHVNKGSMIAQLGNSEAAYPMLKFQLRKDGKPLHADKVKLFFADI